MLEFAIIGGLVLVVCALLIMQFRHLGRQHPADLAERVQALSES
jgi:hypothetical protein